MKTQNPYMQVATAKLTMSAQNVKEVTTNGI
jgi:hypothetical protein